MSCVDGRYFLLSPYVTSLPLCPFVHSLLVSKLFSFRYNWHFDVDKNDPEAAQCVFTVRDFVGDACKVVHVLTSRCGFVVRSRCVSDITFKTLASDSPNPRRTAYMCVLIVGNGVEDSRRGGSNNVR